MECYNQHLFQICTHPCESWLSLLVIVKFSTISYGMQCCSINQRKSPIHWLLPEFEEILWDKAALQTTFFWNMHSPMWVTSQFFADYKISNDLWYSYAMLFHQLKEEFYLFLLFTDFSPYLSRYRYDNINVTSNLCFKYALTHVMLRLGLVVIVKISTICDVMSYSTFLLNGYLLRLKSFKKSTIVI